MFKQEKKYLVLIKDGEIIANAGLLRVTRQDERLKGEYCLNSMPCLQGLHGEEMRCEVRYIPEGGEDSFRQVFSGKFDSSRLRYSYTVKMHEIGSRQSRAEDFQSTGSRQSETESFQDTGDGRSRAENSQNTGSRQSVAKDFQDSVSPHRDVGSLPTADMSDDMGNWRLYLQGGYVIVPEGEQLERPETEEMKIPAAEQTKEKNEETEPSEEKQTERENKEAEPPERKQAEGENKEAEPSEEKQAEGENKEAEPSEEKQTERENKETNLLQEKQEKPKETQKINYVKNLSELQQREQAVSDLCYNSFLLHGFHQYRYLILTNEFIGVPDHFSEREAVAAKMMGFPYFMEAENIEACSLGGEVRSEPPKIGSFGYFLRKI